MWKDRQMKVEPIKQPLITKTTTDIEVEFLRESNAIELVYDHVSLQQAIYAWEYLKEQDQMSIGVALKTHKILMLHQPLLPNEKGYLRDVDVYIGGRKGFPVHSLRLALDGWSEKMNMLEMSEFWKDLHIEYEHIHPFVDGNGRTGRMFMNWHRLKFGLPVLVIKEKEKYAYYDWFEES